MDRLDTNGYDALGLPLSAGVPGRTIGGLLDGRAGARRFELVRVAALAIAAGFVAR